MIQSLAENCLDIGRYSTQVVRLYLCDLQITIQATRRHLLIRQYLSYALFTFMTDRDTLARSTVLKRETVGQEARAQNTLQVRRAQSHISFFTISAKGILLETSSAINTNGRPS